MKRFWLIMAMTVTTIALTTPMSLGEDDVPSATTKPSDQAVLNTAYSDRMVREFWAIEDQKPAVAATTLQRADFKKKQAADIASLTQKIVGRSVRFAFPVADVLRSKTNGATIYTVRVADPSRNSSWRLAFSKKMFEKEKEMGRGEEFDKFFATASRQAERNNIICHIVFETTNAEASQVVRGSPFSGEGTVVNIDWPKNAEDIPSTAQPDYQITIRAADVPLPPAKAIAGLMPAKVPSSQRSAPPTTGASVSPPSDPSAHLGSDIVIPATEGRGSKAVALGPLAKGKTMVFQYVRGEWTAWQGDAAGSPDDATPKNGNVYPVSICEVGDTGVKKLTDIARGTKDKPFEFTADHDIANVVLNMDDAKPRNNKGEVVYRVWLKQ